ncbi:MAG: hypothetical protein RLZZ628_4457 [Bacteroidota bacterium]
MALPTMPRKTPRKGSTAGQCVSAIVLNHFLYIHNMQLFFRFGVTARLEILAVEKSDLYEWNCGQETA